MEYDAQGLSLCGKYAFPPNRLHYCGPQKQTDLQEYLATNITNAGLVNIISQFETLFPYLKLIAGANHIKDPFDRRVVEAYWLGNNLLSNVKPQEYYRHLIDAIKLKSKMPKSHESLNLPLEISFPNHQFHVFNIYVRTGNLTVPQTLETMDNCRISWGKITQIVNQNCYVVSTLPLILNATGLDFGKSMQKQIQSVETNYQIGDWVTFHWNYICAKIPLAKIRNLELYSRRAITIANQNHKNL
jgi:hypothetical protein